jgi:site-specific DNA-cytosine methylase
LNGNCEFTTVDGVVHKIDGTWDLIVAHPPCTYFTVAGAVRMRKGGGNRSRTI